MSKLSFLLTQYDLAAIRLIREVMTGLEKIDPILGQIQTLPVAHDGTTRQVSEPNILDTEMKNHSVETVIEFDRFLKTDVENFRDFLWKMSESFTSLKKKYFFEVISQTTEATGNIFDSQGRNIWDATLEMISKMEMHFDEHGNHNYQFYVNPSTYKKLAENPPTPEQEKEMEELIKTKREEYYAQKRTRRLS